MGQYNPASVSGYLQGLKIYRMSLKKVSWFKFLNEFLYFEHRKYLLKISVLKNRKKTVQNLDSVFYTKAFFSETPCVCKVYCIYHDLNSGYFHFFSLFRNLRKVQCKIACYIIHQYVHCTVLHFVVVLLKEIYQSFGERKNIVFVLSIVNLERLIYISSVDTLNSRINIQCYPCSVLP